jgi:hypothetical protein
MLQRIICTPLSRPRSSIGRRGWWIRSSGDAEEMEGENRDWRHSKCHKDIWRNSVHFFSLLMPLPMEVRRPGSLLPDKRSRAALLFLIKLML